MKICFWIARWFFCNTSKITLWYNILFQKLLIFILCILLEVKKWYATTRKEGISDGILATEKFIGNSDETPTYFRPLRNLIMRILVINFQWFNDIILFVGNRLQYTDSLATENEQSHISLVIGWWYYVVFLFKYWLQFVKIDKDKRAVFTKSPLFY